MKNLTLVLSVCLSIASAWADDNSVQRFPTSPDPHLTPGSLCAKASEIRYAEKIRYCDRAVGSARKDDIIRTYDRELGFTVGQMKRQLFKIDHYIPLCMGGSNESDNLWPQHESVYQYTDELEMVACQKMQEGRLKQADAVAFIKKAKADPRNADKILDSVSSL